MLAPVKHVLRNGRSPWLVGTDQLDVWTATTQQLRQEDEAQDISVGYTLSSQQNNRLQPQDMHVSAQALHWYPYETALTGCTG